MAKHLSYLLLFAGARLWGQDSTVKTVTFAGYVEPYYCYDSGEPENHERPGFVYSFNRHNEINVNLAYVHAAYHRSGVRANLALMAGTYAQYNLAAEHPLFQHVMEASAGVRLSKTKEVWLDAGIMPSHLGFESAVGKLCWNLTRSMLADNSPYYETGVRVGYTSQNGRLYLAGLVLNGWQRIQRPPGNQTPAFGTQLLLRPDSGLTLNWSSFIGNDFPDSAARWRYYNDFYGTLELTRVFALTAGCDVGVQQKAASGQGHDLWVAPIAVLRIRLKPKLSLAGRFEYFLDKDQVIIKTGTPNGFQTLGYSLNMDYSITEHVMWRVEGRTFSSKDPIFLYRGSATTKNIVVTTSLAMSF